MSKEQKRKLPKKRQAEPSKNEPKKKVVKKVKPEDVIEKTTQLASKQKIQRTRSTTSKPTEIRVCENGKPMPSLAELEKMYEDSDEEVSTSIEPVPNVSPTIDPQTKSDVKEILSPQSLQKIADKMVDFISNIPDPASLLDLTSASIDIPTPPIIPPKKRKKPEFPHIVGCKDRPQVPWNPKTRFGVDTDYGIKPSKEDPQEEDNKCGKRKRSKIPNVSKSVFNALSDDIAARLKHDDTLRDQTEHNSDINNDYFRDTSNVQPTSFSPIPSTSQNSSIIMKNEKLFNESISNSLNKTSIDPKTSENDVSNDCIPVETPCEIIDLVDITIPSKLKKEEIVLTDNESAIEIVDEEKKRDSPIVVEDYYSSIDFNQSYKTDLDVCEVIDIDDVIAENNIILNKFNRKETDLNVVTEVVHNTSEEIVLSSSEGPLPIPPKDSQSNSNQGTNDSSEEIEPIPVEVVIDSPIQVLSSSAMNSPANCSIEIVPNPSGIQRAPATDISVTNKLLETLINSVTNFFSTQTTSDNVRSRAPAVNEQTKKLLGKLINTDFSKINCDSPNNSVIEEHSTTSPPVKHRKPPKPKLKKNGPFQSTLMSSVQSTLMSPPKPRSFGDCPICMDSFSVNAVASTVCGHVFCMKCLEAAIKAGGKRCPTCRKVLKGKGYHQIFI